MRLRAFGNFAWRLVDPRAFMKEVSGTRERYTAAEIDGQLRGFLLQHLSDAVAQSGIPFLDLAANQVEFAARLKEVTAPEFARLGLSLETVTLQNISLPEELQKILDQKIGMGMIGQNMGQFMQYQAAQALPKFAENAGQGSGIAGDAMGLGAGMALPRSRGNGPANRAFSRNREMRSLMPANTRGSLGNGSHTSGSRARGRLALPGARTK